MSVEAKGIPVTDWSWWIGGDESVREEGMYDLNEAYSRQDAIDWAEMHVNPGERFHIVEACCRALQADDEYQPFAATRNHAVFDVNSDGNAVEVAP